MTPIMGCFTFKSMVKFLSFWEAFSRWNAAGVSVRPSTCAPELTGPWIQPLPGPELHGRPPARPQGLEPHYERTGSCSLDVMTHPEVSINEVYVWGRSETGAQKQWRVGECVPSGVELIDEWAESEQAGTGGHWLETSSCQEQLPI